MTRSRSGKNSRDDLNCEFCRIVRGERDDAEMVAEGETWVAFFPLQPATPGHTLVISREHVADLWKASPRIAEDLVVAVLDVGKAIEVGLEPDGLNVITSAGKAAEQTVRHLHLHVVPRWSDDGFGEIWPPKAPTSRATKEDVADRIRHAYAAPR